MGAQAKTGYIRNGSAGVDNSSSNSLVYLLENLSANDIVTVSLQLEGVSGQVDDVTPGMLWLWKKEAASGTPTTLSNFTVDPSSAGTITLQTNDLNVAGTLNVASGDTLSIPSSRNYYN